MCRTVSFTSLASRALLGIAALVALGAAAAHSLRLALADRAFRLGTVSGAIRAVELAPADSQYWRGLAVRKGNGRAEFSRALSLNPRDAQTWTEAGLAHEVAGEHIAAERNLLEAARYDRTWKPLWTLTNYYFRRGDNARFQEWARRTAELAPEDAGPLVQLCWEMRPDPQTFLEVLPRKPELLAQALAFAFRRDHPKRCMSLAERLLEVATPREAPILLEFCDRLISTGPQCPGCLGEAVRLWKELLRGGLVPHRSPYFDESSVNPSLIQPFLARGFDWRINNIEGVHSTSRGQRFTLVLSGLQPESCELFYRLSPARPGRRHEIRYRYAGRGLKLNSGVYWRVSDGYSRRLLAHSPDLVGGEGVREDRFSFGSPPETLLWRISLLQERRSGAVRADSEIVWEEVTLTTSEEEGP